MIVSFKNERLEKIFKNANKLESEYRYLGPKGISRLKMRYNELRSVDNLSFISYTPPPRRHKLSGDKKGMFAVDILINSYRLVFRPIGEYSEDDIRTITAVEIMEVTDYHD